VHQGNAALGEFFLLLLQTIGRYMYNAQVRWFDLSATR